MMKSEMRNILMWCLLGLTTSTGLFGQTGNYEFSNLNDFPKVILDTNNYTFNLQLINRDPVVALDGVFSIFISVDGDQETRLVSDVQVVNPIAPGDSITVVVDEYNFDAMRFGGGGVTHDIIVWPMRVGSLPPLDSLRKNSFFIHAGDTGSEELGIDLGDFPNRIREGEAYDLSFDIINTDSENLLYQPVSIFMQVDGGNPREIATDLMPDLPVLSGQALNVQLPAHIFDPVDFAIAGGGGVTHDIIVWPMKTALIENDSLFMDVSYFATAAFTLEEGVEGLPPTIDPFDSFNIYIAAKNIGATSNSAPVDFFVQLDDSQPLHYYQSTLFTAPDYYASTNSASFEVASYFGFSSSDSAYFSQEHELTFWAIERNGLAWYTPITYTVSSIAPAEPQMASMSINNNLGNNSGSDSDDQMLSLPGVGASYNGSGVILIQAGLQPNPFQSELLIQYSAPIIGQVDLSLYNMQSTPVLTKGWTVTSAQSRLSLDTSNLREGLYMYRLEVNGEIFTGKVLKE